MVVEREPVVEELSGDSPTMTNIIGWHQCDRLNILDEDGFGGGKGEIVFVDHNEVLVDRYLLIKVKNFRHSKKYSNEIDFYGVYKLRYSFFIFSIPKYHT